MREPDLTITPQCMKHDPPVPVEVGDRDDDSSRVTCPVCGQDYGSWGEVKAAMTEKAKEHVENDMADRMRKAGWGVKRS